MKKYIVLLIISVLIFNLKTTWDPTPCNIKTAKQAIAPRIFAEQTIDGKNQPIIFTRFVHNKIGVFLSEFARCYFLALDPNFIQKTTGIGIIFWLYFVYFILIQKLYIALLIFLSIPLLPFFQLPLVIVSYAHKIFAIIGLIFLTFKKGE